MADENPEKNRNDRPNAMDVYNFLWRGRDFELSHLWHVSVLLAVFILGIAGIYAVYFKDIFVPYFIMNSSKITECASPILLFVFVPVVITALGVVFSILWIMMANVSNFVCDADVSSYSLGKLKKRNLM